MQSRRGVVVCLSVMLLLAAQKAVTARDALRYQGGIRNALNQRALNAKQLNALLDSLRAKTGWSQLAFGDEGFLTCLDRQSFVGGSAAARTLLAAAMTGTLAFDIESHPRTQAIAFARLAAPVSYQSFASGAQVEVYPLQLDFADFAWLRGPNEVLEAFDLGMVVLHELAHGVWQLPDARARNEEPGDCEQYINKIRRELQLPERQTYFARVIMAGLDMSFGNHQAAELIFMRAQTLANKTRREHFYLRWDANIVGVVNPYRPPDRAPTPSLAGQVQ